MSAFTFSIIMLIFTSVFVGILLGWLWQAWREDETQYEPVVNWHERLTEVRDDQV